MSALTIPVRLQNGVGNPPDAANWMDDYDWLTGIANGVAFVNNGGQERWAAGTTFTNPANGTTLSDGWVEVKSGTSACTADVTREATIVDTGLYSMKVNITGAGSSDSYWAITQTLGGSTGFQSLTVLFGAAVRVSTANKVRLKITDGTTTAYSSYHTGDGTFQVLQVLLAVGATATALTVTVEINPANFTGAVYFDSIFTYVVPAAISARAQTALVYSPLADTSAADFLPTSGGTMTGAIAMGTNKITNLGNGSSAQDAAAFGQIPIAATQSDQETSTSTTVFVSPGRQQYHPSACKGWVKFVGSSGSISASFNVSSVTDDGTGASTINWNVDFSSANYSIVATCGFQTGVTECTILTVDTDVGVAAGTTPIRTHNAAGTRVDTALVWASSFGDQ